MCIHSHLGDEENESCSVCGSRYGDDSERMKKTWIGCDGICGKWFHYKCVGFKRKPTQKTPFLCSACN